MGVEGEAQPRKNDSRRYVEILLGWAREGSAGASLYQTTLATSLLEYLVVLFFGTWLIVEYFYNAYEQQYFGSFNPIFLTLVLMTASAYGFVRLIYLVRRVVGPAKPLQLEDDY